MFDIASVQTGTALHQIFTEDAEPIANAAQLLAGKRGGNLVARIVDDLSNAPDLTARTMRDTAQLLAILELEFVDDLDSEEAARFAMIDPGDPVVEEICLLADRLGHAFEQAAASRGSKLAA